MSGASTDDITGYAAYLKSQGASDHEIAGYTKYLADQHDVDHPADNPTGATTWKDHVRPWLNALPTAGMVVGGIGGTALEGGIPGPGSVLGAGLGGGTGAYLKALGEKHILGDKDVNPEFEASNEVGPSMAAEMAGPVVAKGASKVLGEYLPATGKWVAQKGAKIYANIPEETTARYLENPVPIRGAPTQRDISDRLIGLKEHTDAGVKNAAAEYQKSKDALAAAKAAADKAESKAGEQFADERFEAQQDLSTARDAHAKDTAQLKEALHANNLNAFADDVHGAVGELKDKLISESKKGYDILDGATGNIKVDPLIAHLGDVHGSQFINGVPKSDVAAQTADFARKEQMRLFEMTKSTNGELTPQQAKDLLKHYDTITTYKPDAGAFDEAQNETIKGLRSKMNGQLRTVSPEYAEHMDKNVSPLADLLERSNKLYGTKERAVQTLNNLTTPKGEAIHVPVLHELSDQTGKDLRGPVSDYLSAKQVLKSKMNFDDIMAATNSGKDLSEKRSIMTDITNPEYKRGKLAEARRSGQANIRAAEQGVSNSEGDLTEAERKASLMKGISPENVTRKQWALNNPSSEYGAEKRFQGIDKEFGTNFENEIRNRNDADAFGKDNTRGSKMTLTMGGVGGLVGQAFGGHEGMWLGGLIGSQGGAVMDKYAGDAAKFMLDRGIQMGKITDAASAALRQKQAPQMVSAMVRAGVMNLNQKGEQKWATDGFTNLMKHGTDSEKAVVAANVDKLMEDNSGRKLLVQASDLKPGSKAMQNTMDKVKAAASAHPQDAEAVKWARSNPKDPRAAAVLKANGEKP